MWPTVGHRKWLSTLCPHKLWECKLILKQPPLLELICRDLDYHPSLSFKFFGWESDTSPFPFHCRDALQILLVILLKPSFLDRRERNTPLRLSCLMRMGLTVEISSKKSLQKSYTSDLQRLALYTLIVNKWLKTCKIVFLKLLLKVCNWSRILFWNVIPNISWCFHGEFQFNIIIYSLLKIWNLQGWRNEENKSHDNFTSHRNIATVSIWGDTCSVFFLCLTHLKTYTFRKWDYTVHTICKQFFLLYLENFLSQ